MGTTKMRIRLWWNYCVPLNFWFIVSSVLSRPGTFFKNEFIRSVRDEIKDG